MRHEDVERILQDGRVAPDEVLKLRHHVFWKGVVTPEDAEMVFRVNDRLAAGCDPAWREFFVEALTDYVVFQAEPTGYVSEHNADWLIRRISHSGHVDTATELEVLIKVLERAKLSPVSLVAFALNQVKWGVVEGMGSIGHDRRLPPGRVEEPEVALVRRILYAFGGDGNIAVTRPEAEVLFDINDATVQADNHPAWSDLFVKALANFLMAASGYRVPTRQEALRRAAWLEADRIGRDGRLCENEAALINFLKSRDAHLHPKLLPVLDRAG
jgi:hypothetical protein